MNRTLTLAFAALLGLASAVSADVVSTVDVPLGQSGWLVSGPSFYELNISYDGEGVLQDGTKWVAVTISKNFYYGPDPDTGLFPAIELNFSQMAGVANDDLATRIYVQSEGVYNGTGYNWDDYHWVLYRHGIASFNRDLTAPTPVFGGPGWYIGPFTSHMWQENNALNTEALVVYGGRVEDGETFFPGTGPGNMVIDIEPSDASPGEAVFQFVQFMQDPPVPEPATLTILLAGGLVMLRKRRIA